MSVSPKTQVSSLPRAIEVSPASQPHIQSVVPGNGTSQTPKRKMEDREVSEPALNAYPESNETRIPEPSSSPQPPARKRRRYPEPPIWARSAIGRVKHSGALLTAKRQVNGKQAVKVPHPSATGPNAIPNGHGQAASTVVPSSQPVVAQPEYKGNGPLGPWEPSINGIKPYEEVSRLVADWLFFHVVQRPDAMELSSRGVEVEIEAKLGQLINKDTNERFRLPVQSECLLADNGRVSFKSSMTEVSLNAGVYHEKAVQLITLLGPAQITK